MMSSLSGSGSIFSASWILCSSLALSRDSNWSCLSDKNIDIVSIRKISYLCTHWLCWPATRPNPRSSTSPPGRGAAWPTLPCRSPGWPGGSRPWCVQLIVRIWSESTPYLSNESDCSCHRGHPTVAWEEQRQTESTSSPDTRVPDNVILAETGLYWW